MGKNTTTTTNKFIVIDLSPVILIVFKYKGEAINHI